MTNQVRTMTAWCFWTSWNSDHLEKWLEAKAADGWHFAGTGFGWKHRFVRGAAKKVRYCVDFQRQPEAGYQTLFRDAGWELVHDAVGWYIWRMEYAGARPEVFSDADSLIARNNRIVAFIALCMLPSIPSLFHMLGGREGYSNGRSAIVAITACFAVIGIAAVTSILLHNQRLRARSRV